MVVESVDRYRLGHLRMSIEINWHSTKTRRVVRMRFGARKPKSHKRTLWTSPNETIGWRYGFFHLLWVYIEWELRNRNV